ncbi:hypothetical protein F3Y22_tig00112383pilonHSYRG00143 [Hibiscus syriacus]|uniref:Uncharacterized protein n=1 Tax=Hibiscus syriacus TaxID=106335 RepID=A0A6A2Y8I2_HIBSY|nr:hypothetical protein F3Y22_tig00112383pilonHSYRG00143 [Hibiscus syriacus]
MESEIFISSMEFKVQELLKEVRLHYSLELTKLVDDTITAIKFSLDKIPEDLQYHLQQIRLAVGTIHAVGPSVAPSVMTLAPPSIHYSQYQVPLLFTLGASFVEF